MTRGEDTRVFGASVMRAEGASQKPVNSGVKEHAACKDLMIPKVLSFIWNMNAALSRSIAAWHGGTFARRRLLGLQRNDVPWREKILAVKLDILSKMPMKYTVCRDRIHFFCIAIEQPSLKTSRSEANFKIISIF